MIDSLRCASITSPSLDAHTSESSGPRWIRVSAIRSPDARSADTGCARRNVKPGQNAGDIGAFAEQVYTSGKTQPMDLCDEIAIRVVDVASGQDVMNIGSRSSQHARGI